VNSAACGYVKNKFWASLFVEGGCWGTQQVLSTFFSKYINIYAMTIIMIVVKIIIVVNV